MPHMNMRFPTVITLPWRADAAEFWFARLSHLPFAMLLHSGHADHPYSRFDILVADPLKTLTTDDLSLTDDPLMQLQQAIKTADRSSERRDCTRSYSVTVADRIVALVHHALSIKTVLC